MSIAYNFNGRLTVDFNGDRYSILELSRKTGIPLPTLKARIKRGASLTEAIEPHRLKSSYLSAGYPAANQRDGTQKLIHRIVAERALGRDLRKGEEVHHINEDKSDFSGKNLVICDGREYHLLLHIKRAALKATGDATSRRCKICKEWDSLKSDDLYVDPTGKLVFHKSCRRLKRKSKRNIK
ncbi:HNH endonuclease [Candidatus Pacearchaeota archaeon]|nr:HNH endonuclease [Candidatus Pacearchaeota archaeon]